VQALLQRTWLQRGPLACLLWPLSLPYWLLVRLHKALFELGLKPSVRLGVPVIVVGNVVAGGAGKTPTVIAMAGHLRSRGWRPGIISRGYGRSTADCREVTPDSAPGDVGDEPWLMQRASGCPVFVAASRAEAGQALLAAHPLVNLLICDDGLQHHALQRDIEVVVFADTGVGNGWLLPAGPLREPWPRAADLVLNSGPQPRVSGYRAARALADEAVRSDGSHVPLGGLAGQGLGALAGIARPQPFFDMLRERGLELQQTLPLPDHHDFASAPPTLDPNLTWLCTEKDAGKLWPVQPAALAVPLLFRPEDAFFTALDQLLSNDGNQTA
jgi:tetraacyldisaccharide 4'-kinase